MGDLNESLTYNETPMAYNDELADDVTANRDIGPYDVCPDGSMSHPHDNGLLGNRNAGYVAAGVDQGRSSDLSDTDSRSQGHRSRQNSLYNSQYDQGTPAVLASTRSVTYDPEVSTPGSTTGDLQPQYMVSKDPMRASKRKREIKKIKAEKKEEQLANAGDENEARGNWSGQLDFLLSCLGYAVGLGNVWRFPYLCYRNGGGAFFIPYVIMLIFIGMPLFYMELSLGQFCSSGPLTCWKFAPILKGVGIAQLIISGMVCIYYNMIIAWSLYYFFASFTAELPWANCNHKWNTKACSLLLPSVNCSGTSLKSFSNGTCYNGTTFKGLYDYKLFRNKTGISRMSPSAEYYNNRVLNISDGIENMGGIQWELAMSLFAAWIIAFLCMMKGIKSSGKVVYFTAIFPFIVLVILFFRGVTLPNAWEGISFYIIPSFSRLGDAKVWNDAAIQIFFSLSDCWGGLIALSSYNRFHNNVLRDTIIVTLGNCATSIFAGVVIFSFIGFMAGEMNAEVKDVVDKGPGLAFIVYPDAVSRMPVSPMWALLFFLMLITLGLDSQFAMLETVMTSVMDQFQYLRKKKTQVTFVICSVLFLLGLPMCTRGGVFLLQLMDSYAGGWGLLIIGFLECIGIGWWYGSERFLKDISVMTDTNPSPWWELCWKFFSPILILFVLLFAWIDYSPARYGDYSFPVWADLMGWMMTLASIMWIPIVAVYLMIMSDQPLSKAWRTLTSPTREWGPALVKHRRLVDYVPGFVVDPWIKGADGSPAYNEDPRVAQYINHAMDTRSIPSVQDNINILNRHNSQLSVGFMRYESNV